MCSVYKWLYVISPSELKIAQLVKLIKEIIICLPCNSKFLCTWSPNPQLLGHHNPSGEMIVLCYVSALLLILPCDSHEFLLLIKTAIIIRFIYHHSGHSGPSREIWNKMKYKHWKEHINSLCGNENQRNWMSHLQGKQYGSPKSTQKYSILLATKTIAGSHFYLSV